jgi:hypothetical protein
MKITAAGSREWQRMGRSDRFAHGAQLLGCDGGGPGRLGTAERLSAHVNADYLGGGYSVVGDLERDAIRTVARVALDSALSIQGKKAVNAWESQKVAVGRVNHGAIGFGKGGNLRIRHQIAASSTGRLQQPDHVVSMIGWSFENLTDSACAPRAYVLSCFGQCHGIGVDSGVRADAQKCAQGWICQPNSLLPRQAVLPPRLRSLMKRTFTIVGVQKQVGVRDNHFCL